MLDYKKIDSYREKLKTTIALYSAGIEVNINTYRGYIYEDKRPPTVRREKEISDQVIIFLSQNKIYITRDDILVDSIKEYK